MDQPRRDSAPPLFSLLICTFNRADQLREALGTALAQETDGHFNYEVIVVDNNSSDDTRAVVEVHIGAGARNLRYIFEPRQGKSNALNSGLAALSGVYYTIVDDDFILPPRWLCGIYDGIRRFPDASFLGGKVLPAWAAEPPRWLTGTHWSAVALSDYGEEEFIADAEHRICLLACTFRTQDVTAVGGYDGHLSVSRGRVGGIEDLELLMRLWRAGKFGVYLPAVHFLHRVEAERLRKRYHRRWHRGHGVSHAIMRDEEEQRLAHFADVPRYMYREAVHVILLIVARSLSRRESEAFAAEARLWFILGYAGERWKAWIRRCFDRTTMVLVSRF